MIIFYCNLLITGGCKELLKILQLLQHVTYYVFVMVLLATVNLKWFTCDANFYSIVLVFILPLCQLALYCDMCLSKKKWEM